MTRFEHSLRGAVAAAALAVAGATAVAQPPESPPTDTVVVRHVDLHPRTPRAARLTLDRIGEAALDVCGASPYSLPEVRRAVRASACWHDSMARAVAQIGDPLLANADADAGARRRPRA
jgi:UrcA family protein